MAVEASLPLTPGLAVLIFVLMGLRMEARAPYYAAAVMLIATAFNKETRLTFDRAKELLLNTSVNITSLVAVLAGIGLVVGGLSYSGVAGAFSRELLLHAGGNTALMLIAGAVTSFVLGMGMTVTACYIFLSILLAPALVQAGFHPIASHLFILYWGMLSYITPPVALAAITAANVAGSKPMTTGFHSMRLGMPLFVLPFIFVYDPALIMDGTWLQISERLLLTLTATWMITAAFEGWLYGIGQISRVSRLACAAGGVLILFPELTTSLAGGGILIATIALNRWFARAAKSHDSLS